MTYNFSATIAMQDDNGKRYPQNHVDYARLVALTHSEAVFSVATGNGYDTASPHAMPEPIMILQGTTTTPASLLKALSDYAHNQLNQRAIGWFCTEENTYVCHS